MSRRILQFPARHASQQLLTEGALARDTRLHNRKATTSVENEFARKAGRIAKGRHIEFDKARKRLTAATSPSWLQRLASLFKPS